MKDNTVPLTLISILADGEFHSGEQLGERLGMSARQSINMSRPFVTGESKSLPFRVRVTVYRSLSSFWTKR